MNSKPNESITEDDTPLLKYTKFTDDIQPFINYLEKLYKQKDYIKIMSVLKEHDLIAKYHKDTKQFQEDIKELKKCFEQLEGAYLNMVRYTSDDAQCYDNMLDLQNMIDYDDELEERDRVMVSILHYWKIASDALGNKSIIYKIPFNYENLVKDYFKEEICISKFYEEEIKDNENIEYNTERLIEDCNQVKELIEKYRISFSEYLNNKTFVDIYDYALKCIKKYNNVTSSDSIDNKKETNTTLFNKVKSLFVSKRIIKYYINLIHAKRFRKEYDENEIITTFEKYEEFLKEDNHFINIYIYALIRKNTEKSLEKVIKAFEKYEDIISNNADSLNNYMTILNSIDTLESYMKVAKIYEKYKDIINNDINCIDRYYYALEQIDKKTRVDNTKSKEEVGKK